MSKSKVILLLCIVLTMTGCTGEKNTGGSMGEKVYTALTWRDEALEYDKTGQMRLAELYYKKAYDLMKDDPSQGWLAYGDAGYRYACMLYQRGDMDVALGVVSEMLDKSEGQKDFPTVNRTGLLSLMAQCQLHLAMPEAAKQTFAKAYQNQLMVLGGEKRGDFNMAIMCSNIFISFFEIGEYDEAGKWLSRYENELIACEQLGVGDFNLIEEQKGSLALYKAQYLQATGSTEEAAAVYAAIPRSRISLGTNFMEAIHYLMAAGRYDEAADWYDQLDRKGAIVENTRLTFDIIADRLSPRYSVYRKAGRYGDALAIADSINSAIDSALVWQKKNDASELAVIYQTHEKDLALEKLEAKTTVYRLLAIAVLLVCLLIAYLLWRSYKYNKVLTAKNRKLYEEIEQHRKEEQQEMEQLQAAPEEQLTADQQLFRRLCILMEEQQPYTDEALNRDSLARLLGTNAKYLEQAIRQCSKGETPGDFITRYRLEHVARLLKTTDDPIAIIGELAGIPSRATLARLFRNAYGMSPTEYRKI